jgi:anaerobic dimethyl sulfoxide reductase subunit A
LNYLHIPLTGTDGRTREQLLADIKFQTAGQDGANPSLDLTAFPGYNPSKPLRVEVIGVTSNSNHFNTNPNVNKNKLGLSDSSVAFSFVKDNVMTPTAAYSDMVLPSATHFESENNAGTGLGSPGYYLMENLCEPLSETITNQEFTAHLRSKINQKFGIGDGSYIPPALPTLDNVQATYEAAGLTDVWSNKYGASFKPSWDELRNNGVVDIAAPATDPIIGFKDIVVLGELYNSTGLINFFSPFWYIRMKMSDAVVGLSSRGATVDYSGGPSGDYYGPGWRTATAKYIPVPGGYEDMFDNKNPKTGNFVGYTSPASGKTYKMLYMTNKSRHRAHTAFDSTAIIKDQFPQRAKINPSTAAERGIREGDMVYVYNDRGCIKIPAELTHKILPGYVSIEHGAWYRAHPTETVTIWIKNRLTSPPTYSTEIVPVDIGGTDNVLTDDDNTLDTPFSCQTLAAQTGPCEVSKVKPN